MCSYYAGRKHWLHRNVTYSMTNETPEALNLAHYSQMLQQSQPLACTAELGYLNRWPALEDRRGRGRAVSRKGLLTSSPSEPARGRALWMSLGVIIARAWGHPVTSLGTCYFLIVKVSPPRLGQPHFPWNQPQSWVPAALTCSFEGRKVSGGKKWFVE